MPENKIQVKILRSPSTGGAEPYYESYHVPLKGAMSVSNVLQYINEQMNGGLAFYVSCRQGLCRGCAVRVNNRTVFACTHLVSGDIVVEPLDKTKVIRDLVIE
jgi:succinate dehydrogenase/fumarate reductase-like Fe-S protein